MTISGTPPFGEGRRLSRLAMLALAGLILGSASGEAQTRAAKTGAAFSGFGSNSKEPIKVDANKLEVFDKENRAVYSGDVVVVQGQTTVRSSLMTVHYQTSRTGSAPAAPSNAPGQNSIRRIEFDGPVSVLSGTQSATSRAMVYDAQSDTVTLTGNVVISDCDNIQRGERVIYDVKSGRANVDAGPKGRVQAIFTPGSEEKKNPGECAPKR